jgi:hypothetical protein
MNLSEKYRLKALACETLGRDAPNSDFKLAWAEIAIEWHALAAQTAPGQNGDILKLWSLDEVKQLLREKERTHWRPN